jgi:hypothetical protein
MSIRHALKFLLPLALIGCSPSDDLRLAEKEVEQFHEMFNAGEYEVMYVNAAQHLKDTSSKKDFVSLVDKVHQQIGSVKSSDQKSWGIESNTTDGTLVKLTYHVVGEKGFADEDFTYQIKHHRAALGHYKVRWRALVPS